MVTQIKKIDLLDDRSELVQEVLGKKPRGIIRWGISVITIILATLLSLTFIVKYPDVISAKVLLTSSDPPAKLISETSGRIKLFVSDGEEVNKGAIIATIENSADINEATELIDTIRYFFRKYQDINLRKSDLDYLSQFDDLGGLQGAFNEFYNSIKDQYLFLKNKPVVLEMAATEEQIKQYRIAIQLKQNQVKNFERELDISRKDFERNRLLYKEDVISSTTLEEKEVIYLKSQSALNQVKSDIQNDRLQISELEKRLVILKNNELSTDDNLDTKIESSFKNFMSEVSHWHHDYVLRAPIDGKVALLDYWSNNHYVKEDEYIASVIPTHSSNEILVIAKSPIHNSGKLRKDIDVRVNLDGYPFEEYGSLKGSIKSISLLPKEENYIIEIKLDSQDLITTVGKQIDFKHEMEGAAELITEDIRLIERLFYELRKIFSGNRY